jgi:hypothetical protein
LGRRLPPTWTEDLLPETPRQASLPRQGEEFVITDQTEIHLDGQPCAYRDVPRGARIVHLEVAADMKTVLKIHFRTRK